MANTDPARPDFVLNICGPLVTADLNSSSCNTHSACAFVDNEYMVWLMIEIDGVGHNNATTCDGN